MMPSLFQEYRTLLELLYAAVGAESAGRGDDTQVTLHDLEVILSRAIDEVDAAEAQAAMLHGN